MAALLAGGGWALAASSGKIRACASKRTGALRLAAHCSKHERSVTWNQRGPAGRRGPAGPASGHAGGALTGNYPNPGLASGVVSDGNVRPGSLTGASINASTLGKVPSATSADTAHDASTLPSGQTERGTWAELFDSPAAGGEGLDSESFAFPLSTSVPATVIGVGGSSTATCPGTVADPEAAAGHLCLYTSFSLNAGVGTGDPVTLAGNRASAFGFEVDINAPASGDSGASGTWAVTAP